VLLVEGPFKVAFLVAEHSYGRTYQLDWQLLLWLALSAPSVLR
jgi:hypothetical protein